MICKNCGTNCTDDLRFCPTCGTSLTVENAAPQQPEVQQPEVQQPQYTEAQQPQQQYQQPQYGQPQQQYQQPQQYGQPQQQYQQPQQPGYNYPPVAPVAQPGKGLAIASMILGIVSFLCFPLVTGLLGIIFGGVAKSKGYTGKMATAGIICGVVGLALWVVMLFLPNPFTAMMYMGL